jgi:hypothetical protein
VLQRGDEFDNNDATHEFLMSDSILSAKHIRRKLELDWGLRQQKATLRQVFDLPSAACVELS